MSTDNSRISMKHTSTEQQIINTFLSTIVWTENIVTVQSELIMSIKGEKKINSTINSTKKYAKMCY